MTVTQEPAAAPTGRPMRPTGFALFLALVGVSALMLVNPPRAGHSLGFAIGWSLANATTVFVVLWLAALRTSGRKVGWRYFAILVAWSCVLGGGLFGLGAMLGRDQPGMTEEQHAYQAVVAGDNAAQRTRLAAIGDIFDPALLHGPQDLAAARGRLAQRRRLVQDTYNLMLQRQTQERVRIAARWPQSLAEFDEGVRSARGALDRRLAAQMTNLDAVAAELDLLQNAAGRWRIQNGSISFDQPRDDAAFDAADRRIETTANQAEGPRP